MDMMDALESLDPDSVPDLGGGSVTGLIDGPFVVDHNGNRGLGALMRFDGDGVTLVVNGSPVFLRDAFQLDVNTRTQTLTFTDPEFGSVYTITPLDKGNMKEFWPGVDFAHMDEFKDFLLRKAQGVLGKISDKPELAVIVADDDAATVLGLYQYSQNNMQARQQGQWETLNAQSPEWETIEEGQWVPVLSGALQYWDENEDKEKITTNDIQNWVVGN